MENIPPTSTESVFENIYKSLFEMTQTQSDLDIVWGFGRGLVPGEKDDERKGNGSHVLEVRVEVELADDGSLLVMPCKHTGVNINREILCYRCLSY